MNLLEQSLWWLLPYALLMVVMLHAMMEFTVSLLAKPAQPRRRPLSAGELRGRLLALNEGGQPFRLVEGQDCDLEINWEEGEPPPPGRLAIAGGSAGSRLRLLLDEPRHELRLNQVSRAYYFFFGLRGWLPRLGGYASFQSGPPGQLTTREIGRVANRAGWQVRPVLWWFQATHRGHRFLEALTPAPLRRWPARRTWGLLYPLSFFLGLGYLALIIGPLDRHNLLLLAGVSAGWWGVWGLLAWTLCGFPAFWRRRRG